MQTTLANKTENRKTFVCRGYSDVALAQFRAHVLDLNQKIVEGYEIVMPETKPIQIELPSYEQLAFLRADNTINVDKLLRAEEKNLPQKCIDIFSDEVLETHIEGRRVYWGAIKRVLEHGYRRIDLGDEVDLESREALKKDYEIAKEKIAEIEKGADHREVGLGFPGVLRVLGYKGNPLELFQEIVAKHEDDIKNHKLLCEVVELAYRGAYDTLMLKECLDGVERNVTFSKNNRNYKQAKDAHQWRGLAFWQPVHKVHLLSYEKVCERNADLKKEGELRGADLDEQTRLRVLADWSGEKLEKLERRHLGMKGYNMTIEDLAGDADVDFPDNTRPPIHLKRTEKGITKKRSV